MGDLSVRGRRGGAAAVIAAVLALLVVALPSTAQGKTKLSISLPAVSQADLVDSGELDARVKSKSGQKLTIRVGAIASQEDADQIEHHRRLGPRQKDSVKPGKRMTVTLPLNGRGKADGPELHRD